MKEFPYVITVSSEKGGVGKTTLATNLAVYLKAFLEDVPVTICSFDNHFTVDKMFGFSAQSATGNVADFLTGAPADTVVLTGEYGVDYLPSAKTLEPLRRLMQSPRVLSHVLALSGLSGIVIVDTRPDLDVFTQNALFAADKVLIPVKDMASVDNCRNIFDLFDRWQIDRRRLTVVPCIVDQRIKFAGLLRDQKTLLRKFAESRGFRCSDVSISKSPKVESLSTNPHGKIYPVITHARGTEIHSQFTLLARNIIAGLDADDICQCETVWREIERLDIQREQSFLERMAVMEPLCPLCGAKTANREAAGGVGYFYQSSDAGAYGFLHSDCVKKFIYGAVFKVTRDAGSDQFAAQFIEESMRESIFVLAPDLFSHGSSISFKRYDFGGGFVSATTLSLADMKAYLRGREHSLSDGDDCDSLLGKTILGANGGLRGSSLILVPVDCNHPYSILKESEFTRLQDVCDRIIDDLDARMKDCITKAA